jgi:NAD(P)-dependent dehydrogenase (short-subunit alcohol dehydrogenase family)
VNLNNRWPNNHRIASQWQVNVVGLVFFTTALLPLIEKSKEKKVINIASMLGDLGFTDRVEQKFHYSSYSVTKAAVTMANLKFHHE